MIEIFILFRTGWICFTISIGNKLCFEKITALSQLMFILVFLNNNRANQENLTEISQDLRNVDFELRKGKLNSALRSMKNLYEEHRDLPAIQNSYLKILIEFGSYSEVLEIASKNKDQNFSQNLVTKARKLQTLARNINQNIEELYQNSPYKKLYAKKFIEALLKKKELPRCLSVVKTAMTNFPQDVNLQFYKAFVELAGGRIQSGIDTLNLAGSFRAAKDLQFILNRQKELEVKGREIKDMRRVFQERIFDESMALIEDLKRVSGTICADSQIYNVVFGPLESSLIKIYLEAGICLKSKKLFPLAERITEISVLESDRALLIQAYILNDELEKAQKELDSRVFRDRNLYEKLLQILEDAKRQDEKKKQREQEQKQKGQQQKHQYRGQQQYKYQQQEKAPSQRKDDPLGYYKILGVKKDATKAQIKKAFRDLVVKLDPDQYKGKDEKLYNEYTEKMSKINKAKDCLMNDKRREQYDSGMLDENGDPSGTYGNGQQQYFQAGNMGDFFDMFFGGAGNAFFSHGGASGGHYYGGRSGGFTSNGGTRYFTYSSGF